MMGRKMLFKLLILGGISLVLLAVLGLIDGLAQERKGRLDAVELDIANSYAGMQQFGGPVFKVTYRAFWTDHLYNEEKDVWYDKEMSAVRSRLVFPSSCTYDGTMSVEERRRGIFKANTYQSKGRLSGRVDFPSFESLSWQENVQTELVSVDACFIVSDPRGLPTIPVLQWNDQTLSFSAGSALSRLDEGIHAEVPNPEDVFGQRFDFSTDLELNGTRQLRFIPIAEENHITLKSEWPHPSFFGDFLPDGRDVSAEGFSANWNVNALASSARQNLENGNSYVQSFGVSLMDPIGLYSLTDRALKYGYLFIFITFAAFWLFEVLAALRIHPVQYSFVGLAQAIFFLLLLSLSEHIGFGVSYGLASLATIGLIVLYVCHILHSLVRGLLFGAMLALLYGVLYALLQSEDHALVAGSALLFGLITLVMMLTRKVDWYALGPRAEGTVQ